MTQAQKDLAEIFANIFDAEADKCDKSAGENPSPYSEAFHALALSNRSTAKALRETGEIDEAAKTEMERRMDMEGITEQDIAETMPPK